MPTETVQIPTSDGRADALLVTPDGDGPHPGVLMHPDIFGPRPVIEGMARELASHGYVVLVPNLFYREGSAPVVALPDHIGEAERPALLDQLMPLLRAHTAERVRADADAYLGFLGDRPEVADGPVGTTGYCFGGVLAWRTAAARPDRVAAVASFHPGNLVTDAPDSPHLLADRLAAEIHVGHADGDMTTEALDELDRALAAAGVAGTSEVYPGAAHGFTMADTDAFDPTALQRHWDRLLPLLGRTLAGE